MIELALECPTELLDIVQPYADFYFALTHLVLKDPEYARFYGEGFDKELILDNGTNELLEPCSLEDIKLAADLINPDIIIAPDYLGDDASTIAGLDAAVDLFGKDRVMPVIQGQTEDGVVKCADEIKKRGFNWVAVPYDILCSRDDSIEKMAEERSHLVRYLSRRTFSLIHLLGLTTLEELSEYRDIRQVKSIDTGSPVMHGLKGIRFGRDELLDKRKPTLDRMDSDGNHEDEVLYNIGYLKGILSGGC